MHKKFLRIFFNITVVIVVVLVPGVASSHVLKVDGNIGVVLHVEPNDEPVVGQQTNLLFDIKDKKDEFRPEICDCTVIISQNEQAVFTTKLFTGGSTSPAFRYSFLAKGIYSVSLHGRPIAENAFQPFTLSYDIRVDKEAENILEQKTGNWLGGHMLHVILFGGAFVVVFAIYFKDLYQARRKNK